MRRLQPTQLAIFYFLHCTLRNRKKLEIVKKKSIKNTFKIIASSDMYIVYITFAFSFSLLPTSVATSQLAKFTRLHQAIDSKLNAAKTFSISTSEICDCWLKHNGTKVTVVSNIHTTGISMSFKTNTEYDKGSMLSPRFDATIISCDCFFFCASISLAKFLTVNQQVLKNANKLISRIGVNNLIRVN